MQIFVTNGPEHAGQIASELAESCPDVLAVCGGDGTVNEVVTRVPQPSFPLAVLPAGTANVLAREIGVPLDPVEALEIALEGRIRRVDTGVVRGRGTHHFLLMSGVGFDAHVAWRVRPAIKRRIGKYAFHIASLQTLAGYAFPEFEVVIGGEVLPATSVVAANARGYGGGLLLTPEADMCDGMLDILVVQGSGRMDYASLLYSAWRRRPLPKGSILRRRAPKLEVRGPRGLWVHADGEMIGTLPLEISVNPSSFPLLVPK